MVIVRQVAEDAGVEKGGRSASRTQVVEAMLADVIGDAGIDGGGEGGNGSGLRSIGRGPGAVQGGADGAGGGGFVEFGQQVEVRLVGAAAAQAQDESVAGRRIATGDGDGGGQGGGKAAEIEAGAGGDGEVAGEEEVSGAIPAADGQKRVSAEKANHLIAGGERGAQGADGVDGVVGAAVGAGLIDEGQFHAGLAIDGEARHGDAVGKTGLGAVALERLHTDRGEEHAVEAEALHGQARERDVAAMRRVEAAAKEADLHRY